MKYIVTPFALLIPFVDSVLVIPIAKILDSNSSNSLAAAFGLNTAEVQDTFSMIFHSEDAGIRNLLASSSIAGAVFGAAHFLAWNYGFPSHPEQMIWRYASLGIVISCALSFSGTFALYITERFKGWIEYKLESGCVLVGVGTLLPVLIIPVPLVYPIARMILLILAIASLRSLPPSAFSFIPWVEYIPHI